jgi:hypothetical protein
VHLGALAQPTAKYTSYVKALLSVAMLVSACCLIGVRPGVSRAGNAHPLRRCGTISVSTTSYGVEIWDRYGARLSLSCPDARRVATWCFTRASRVRSWPNPGHNLDWEYGGNQEGCYHAWPYAKLSPYTCDIYLPNTATEQDVLIGVSPALNP